MKIEHLGFVEAVERLADRVGLQLHLRGRRPRACSATAAPAPGWSRRTGPPPSSTPSSCATPEAAAGPRVPRRARLRPQTRPSTFGCGYAPRGLGRADQAPAAAAASPRRAGTRPGCAGRGSAGPIDRFHRRLLWPIRDLGGDVVGFGARRLFDDDRHRGQVPQHRRDPDLQEVAGALRHRPGQAGDRAGAARPSSSRATPT